MAMLIGAGWLLLPGVQAAEHWTVEGANGLLRVHGTLTESACRLEMDSAWQDINLGNMSTGRLRQIGERGTPVAVQLRLQDCLPGRAYNPGERTGNLVWSPDQPAVSISFSAPADADNPQLVRVQGAGGLALRLTDALGRDVRLGSRGTPVLLMPGQNELTYTITPERTQAALQPGAYWARVNVGLSYD
ncbi:fimbrial protein [Pragia fontium]|uniref:fimbrial protein n=1 Tax=Pragia fontium TaxID=82985 RepID=UPI001F2671E1|nr:fimbrial protein [Pragia fontium]